MNEITTFLINYGVLGIIALFYFKENKEDRSEKKEMHKRQEEQNERMITVIQTNSSILNETKSIHIDLNNTIDQIRYDIEILKQQSEKSVETLAVVQRLEDKLQELLQTRSW